MHNLWNWRGWCHSFNFLECRWLHNALVAKYDWRQDVSGVSIYKNTEDVQRWLLSCTLEVQDQTKNGLLDDPCKGFPTTNGQSLVFRLPGCMFQKLSFSKVSHTQSLGDVIGKEEGGAGSDHPVRRSFPEGNYLQALAAGSIQGIVGCTPTNVPLWEIPM